MRKDMIKFLGRSCFLEIIAFFLHSEQVLVNMESLTAWGCQLPWPLITNIFESH